MRPPYVINIGLPRTSTKSFVRATQILGYKGLHIWKMAEANPKNLEMAKNGSDEAKEFLSSFDTLANTPFYTLKEAFETHFPHTKIVCTIRSKESWIESMIRLRVAGGTFMQQHYQLNNFPYTREDADELGRVYDHHYNVVCDGVDVIDLSVNNSIDKWAVLCSGFSDSDALLKKNLETPWPHVNQ